jgi:hypothetical protein
MKNIHVLPTDKPSRLYYNTKGKCYAFSNKILSQGGWVENQNIYITSSDEEIKDCWVLNIYTNEVYFVKGFYGIQPIIKKIILTTDQDLITDGVQAIDDEFLEWFVSKANDSGKPIDIVEARKEKYSERFDNDKSPIGNPDTWGNRWVLVFPKEEPKQDLKKEMFELEQELDIPSHLRWHNSKPKQETLEEAAMNYLDRTYNLSYERTTWQKLHEKTFIAGAKWQQEQKKELYSKEDLESAFVQGALTDLFNTWGISEKDMAKEKFAQWFEQFKKKQEN